MSVDLAAHDVVRVGASGSVLAGRQVAQGRVPKPVVVVVLEVFDHHYHFEQAAPVISVEAFFRSRLLNDSMCPLFHGAPVGMQEIPIQYRQNCCSTCELNSESLPIRNTSGGPPRSAKALSKSSINRCAVIDRSTMLSTYSLVCSSIVDEILIAFPSAVESN